MSYFPPSGNQEWVDPLISSGPANDGGQPVLPAGQGLPGDEPDPGPSQDLPVISTGGERLPAQSDFGERTSDEAFPGTSISTTTSEPSSGSTPSQEKNIFKKQRNLLLQSWASLPKRASFLKGSGKSLKGAQKGEREEEDLAGAAAKTQAAPPVTRLSWTQADSIKSSSWPLTSHGAASRTVSSPPGGSLPLDAAGLERAASRAMRAHLKQKILQLSEQLRVEQTNREENTVEYLQVVAKAERHQVSQVRHVFEKRNQKASATIAQLQRRLQECQRKLQDLENHSYLGRQVSSLQLNIESRVGSLSHSVLTLSEALSASMQDMPGGLLGSHLSASDSALSLETASSASDVAMSSHARPMDDKDSLIRGHISFGHFETTKSQSPERSYFTNNAVMEQLTVVKNSQASLEEEYKALKGRYLLDHRLILDTLQEEKYRHSQLEGQMNDLQELHRSEIINVKQELACMEEKVAYQSYEKSRDIWETMESFHTRIYRLEGQQMSTQQEASETSSGLMLYGKAINLLLAIVTILLIFLSAVNACTLPLVKTRRRTMATMMGIVAFVVVWQNWEVVSAFVWDFWGFSAPDSLFWRILGF